MYPQFSFELYVSNNYRNQYLQHNQLQLQPKDLAGHDLPVTILTA